MPTQMAYNPSRKFLALIGIALMLSLFGTGAVLLYLGKFTDVVVSKNTAPAYRLAYVMQVGPTSELDPLFENVKQQLAKAEVEPLAPSVMILDDNSVLAKDRRSKVGYLVPRNAYIPAPLEVEEIPEREVLMATFDGSAMMGSYKAYPAMIEWANKYGYKLSMPALEIYHPEQPNEYQLNISKADDKK